MNLNCNYQLQYLFCYLKSLDYDIWTNDLQIKEEQSKGYQHILKINIIRWILYLLTGLITGIIAFLIDILVDYTLTLKSRALQNCILFEYWVLTVD